MFESDGRKELRGKYNKLTSISAATGKGKYKSGVIAGDELKNLGLGGSKSVYGELKLSEKLADDLNIVRE